MSFLNTIKSHSNYCVKYPNESKIIPLESSNTNLDIIQSNEISRLKELLEQVKMEKYDIMESLNNEIDKSNLFEMELYKSKRENKNNLDLQIINIKKDFEKELESHSSETSNDEPWILNESPIQTEIQPEIVKKPVKPVKPTKPIKRVIKNVKIAENIKS